MWLLDIRLWTLHENSKSELLLLFWREKATYVSELQRM